MKDELITVDAITKVYQHKHALNAISFTIQRGEILGLLGVNGAGKTTLSSIIATLCPPTSGNILWNQKSVYDALVDYRSIVGFCPQKPNLDKLLTIEENLFFAGKYYAMTNAQTNERITELSVLFDLSDILSEKTTTLSGGFKQRVSIARSLIPNPQLLILDEPTVGLDPHVRRNLWGIIKRLKSYNVTTILTTHYLDEAEFLADRVCIIEKGSLIAIDTPENLKKIHEKKNLEEVFLKMSQEQSKNGQPNE